MKTLDELIDEAADNEADACFVMLSDDKFDEWKECQYIYDKLAEERERQRNEA